MLVITRKPGEQLLIGEDVVVTVLSVRGDKVRIGIEGPKTIPVWRAEIKPKTGGTECPPQQN